MKKLAQRKERDETVMLIDGDLEKIVDVVTLDIEEKWVALEEHHKAAISTI